jgi:hypothetical protein
LAQRITLTGNSYFWRTANVAAMRRDSRHCHDGVVLLAIAGLISANWRPMSKIGISLAGKNK